MGSMVNNFEEYIGYLYRFVNSHSVMSEDEICKFIDENDLTHRFGITIQDVRDDLSSLSHGVIQPKNNSRRLAMRSDVPALQLKGGIPGKMANKNEFDKRRYYSLISEWSRRINQYSVTKIEDLLRVNQLHKAGLSAADVVADIEEYRKMQHTRWLKNHGSSSPEIKNSSIGVSIHKSENGVDATQQSTKKHLKRDFLTESHRNRTVLNLNEQTAIILREKIKGIEQENPKVLKGLIADCFYDDPQMKNISNILVDKGMIAEMQSFKGCDSRMVYRFKKIIENEYGINSILIEKCIEIWSEVLGIS